MKENRMGLIEAVNHISQLPGNTSIRVYFDYVSFEFIISDEDIVGTRLFCAGQPDKFFSAITMAVWHHVMNTDHKH